MKLVLLATLAVLATIAVPAALLLQALDTARASVEHVQTDVERPLSRLNETLEANTLGETQLHRAAAATGGRRSELLSLSIATAEKAAKAWTSYRAVALPLPRERTLAERYERDYDAGKALASAVLVPIITSGAPAPLPAEQVLAAETNRQNLIALIDVYRQADEGTLSSLAVQTNHTSTWLLIGTALLVLATLVAGSAGLRAAQRVADERRSRAERAAIDELEARMIRGLELVDDEVSAFELGATALSSFLPDIPVAILSSVVAGGRLSPIVGATACGVTDTAGCPALQAGSPLQFPSSTSLDACPTLSRGAAEPCSVTCLPISVAGADAGLVQLIGAVDAAPVLAPAHHLIVRRVGERVTLLRAVAGMKHEATRDPLTDLLNRRSLEASVVQLHRNRTPYTVAYADLDHFKLLNDEHGHDAGDRALRDFARTLRDSLRPEDLVCRWGGEEFVVVLPGCSRAEGVDAMERVRSALVVQNLAKGGLGLTVSCGVADATPGETFEDTTARADRSLRQAKAAGRNRVLA